MGLVLSREVSACQVYDTFRFVSLGRLRSLQRRLTLLLVNQEGFVRQVGNTPCRTTLPFGGFLCASFSFPNRDCPLSLCLCLSNCFSPISVTFLPLISSVITPRPIFCVTFVGNPSKEALSFSWLPSLFLSDGFSERAKYSLSVRPLKSANWEWRLDLVLRDGLRRVAGRGGACGSFLQKVSYMQLLNFIGLQVLTGTKRQRHYLWARKGSDHYPQLL